jgi:transcriptional regulator with XRE-family HTH domain
LTIARQVPTLVPVNLATLKTLARVQQLSQSDIARRAGVSRQAVSAWFQSDATEVGVRSHHLKNLAEGLGVPAETLLSDLPGLTRSERDDLPAQLNWDHLYPDLDAYVASVIAGDARALGRLVETFGLYRSAKLAGNGVWTRFPEYLRFIHPARRPGLEQLWRWKKNRTQN